MSYPILSIYGIYRFGSDHCFASSDCGLVCFPFVVPCNFLVERQVALANRNWYKDINRPLVLGFVLM